MADPKPDEPRRQAPRSVVLMSVGCAVYPADANAEAMSSACKDLSPS